MKKKRLISILTLFMCVALVSIGFAAWVVTGDSHNEATGNVEVTTVEDKRLNINITGQPQNIVFGAPQEFNNQNSWLKAPDKFPENLTAKIDFTVDNYEMLDHIDASLTVDGASLEAYKTACANGDYIVEPDKTQIISKNDTGTYSVAFTWKWGKLFSNNPTTASEGQNPYTFYNQFLSAGTDVDAIRTAKLTAPKNTNANYALKDLDIISKLTNVTFKISIHAVAVGSKQK